MLVLVLLLVLKTSQATFHLGVERYGKNHSHNFLMVSQFYHDSITIHGQSPRHLASQLANGFLDDSSKLTNKFGSHVN